MQMTTRRWDATNSYLSEVFGAEDDQLASLMARAVQARIPDIAVNATVGHLLGIATAMCNAGRGAEKALELGTLAGYSAIWIARSLAPAGKLITVEPIDLHADFAEAEFRGAGVADRIEVRRNEAIPVMEELLRTGQMETFDLVFMDAIKSEYPKYLELARPLLKPGAVLVADNALGGGTWWIDDPPGENKSRDGADAFNRAIASDDAFECTCLPLREGLVLARKVK